MGGPAAGGTAVGKCRYYWNAGTIVFEPSARLYEVILHFYCKGTYPNSDPGCFDSEQDLLQYVYWNELGGKRVGALPHGDNFRGYPCSYEAVRRQGQIRIVHKAKGFSELIRKACANGDAYLRALKSIDTHTRTCPLLPACEASAEGDAVMARRRAIATANADAAARRLCARFGPELSCTKTCDSLWNRSTPAHAGSAPSPRAVLQAASVGPGNRTLVAARVH